MTTRIPPLLEPYTYLPPPESLVLLTSVLGASTNWLVLRFLYDALSPNRDSAAESETAVVLVSFMRDFDFWRDGARRLVGAQRFHDLFQRHVYPFGHRFVEAAGADGRKYCIGP